MSHGSRPVPAARLVLLPVFLPLTCWLAIAGLARPCLGSPPPLPDNRLGYRQAPLLLLSRPDVRADVGLDATQAADAERALTDLYVRALPLKGKTGPEADAARYAINQAEASWLKTRLSDAQRKRLVQIDLQWEGPSALISRPIVADHVGITPEQRKGLLNAIAQSNLQRDRTGDWRESEHQLALQALKLLSKEQQERWYAMLGRRFTPQLADMRTAPPH